MKNVSLKMLKILEISTSNFNDEKPYFDYLIPIISLSINI